ncbi:MAG: hypothetical protein EAZ61_11995 [Oscillatoriales cyanobacterium]|nr:MAG: hypothetical protein EAZ61_11995 [Oscillatoriales cyanobacterium]
MGRDALVVGISRYTSLSDLDAPVRDAEAIAQALEKSDNPFTVERLPLITDKENDRLKTGKKTTVSRKMLRKALIQKFKPAGATYSDTVLFYFSGHGLYDPAEDKSYLAASDADPDDFEGCYALRDLAELMRNSPVKQQIVWLDCCHSGGIVAVNQARPTDAAGYSRCFVAASQSFEMAYERSQADSFSVLTDGLLRGLDPENPDLNLKAGAWIDTASLCAYLSQYFKVHGQTYPQRPLFSYIGDPVLLARKSSASVVDDRDRPLRPDIQPYRALEAFDADDTEFFFGRTTLTDKLLAQIYDEPFLAVLGPSGSGKSSVVRAGLLPELTKGARRDTQDWQILPVMKPGDSPLEELFEALASVYGFKTVNLLSRDFDAEGAANFAQQARAKCDKTIVLVIDQFEEIFTLCRGSEAKDRERGEFLECLFGAVDALAGKLRLVVTMRADFLGKCLEREDLAGRISAGRVDVTPLNEDEITEIIVQPAAQVGLRVAENLTKQIVQETRERPGSLPLLEYALTEVWEAWRGDYAANPQTVPELTKAHYETAGGLVGALEKQASKVYAQCDGDAVRQGLVQRIFLELVQPGVETEDTRRRVRKSELVSEVHPLALVEAVLAELVVARLVVTDESEVVDLAHEALIRHWEMLRGWLEKHRKHLPLLRELREDARQWAADKREAKYWLRGADLETALRLLEPYRELGYLDRVTCEFIEGSQESWIAEETEKEKQILEALYMTAEVQWNDRDQLNSLLTITKAAERVRWLRDDRPDILPDNAAKIAPKLQLTLYDRIQETQRLEGHRDSVNAVVYSPDGQTLASASADKSVKLWDVRHEGLDLDSLLATARRHLANYLHHNPNVSPSDKKLLLNDP